MNGFPYWQFHNERWLTGKVSSLDLDAQGLFLYFCMAAWASRGAFNICSTSVRLRFRKSAEWIADTLGVMVEIGILIEDGEKYRIKFIDEQIAEMNEMREKRSKAGKASAESRHNTRDEDNTKEEERKGKVTTVLESVQHGSNKCSTHVDALKPPKQEAAIPECLANVEGFAEAIAADAAQAANAEPPVTRAEADARAAQAGVPPDIVEKWWLFQVEQGWVNARGHRMSRDGAFASLLRWKISEHRFAKLDELTAKRIEAAEAIASRNGRNQATAHTGDPRNAKPGGFYDSGSPEDAWPELTAAERRAEEREGGQAK